MAEKKLAKSGKWSASATWNPAGAPEATDDAVLEGAFEVKIEATAKCRSIKMATGYTGKVVHATKIKLEVGTTTEPPEATAVKFIAGGKYEPAAEAQLMVVSTYTAGVQKLFFGTQELQQFVHNQENVKLKLEDALKCKESISSNAGELDTNGQEVEAKTWVTALLKFQTLTLGASKIKLTNSAAVKTLEWTEKCTVSAGTSVIELSDEGATTKGVTLVGQTLNKLIVRKTNEFSGTAFTVKELELLAAASTTRFTPKYSVTVTGSVTANGKAGELVLLKLTSESAVEAESWLFVNSTGANVSLDYLELQGSKAEGANNSYAGTHSVEKTNVHNWKFEAPPAGGVTTGGKATIVFAAKATAASSITSQAKTAVLFASKAASQTQTATTAKTAVVFAGKSAMATAMTASGSTAVTFAAKAKAATAIAAQAATAILFAAKAKATATAAATKRVLIAIFED